MTIELTSKVADWLRDQGYPLEMRVARAFEKAGFQVIQSAYYLDPVSQKNREIDVVAWMPLVIEGNLLRLDAVIECKSGKSRPWVMFASENRQLSKLESVIQRATNKSGRAWLNRISNRQDIQELRVFRLPARPSYGLIEAFKGSPDAAYSAVIGCATAAAAQVLETNENHRVFHVTFPIVVTEAPLYEAYLDSGSELTVEAITRSVLLWRNPVYGAPHTIVHVIQASEIETFASELYEDLRVMLGAVEEIKEAVKDRRKKLALDLASDAAKRVLRSLP